MQIQYRGGGAFWNVVGIICQSAICIPLLKFSKTPFELFVDNALLGSCSDRPPSLGFFGSSWVVWGQKMSTLKTLMSQVLPNTLVKVLFGSKTWGAQIFVWGGGATAPLLRHLCSRNNARPWAWFLYYCADHFRCLIMILKCIQQD